MKIQINVYAYDTVLVIRDVLSIEFSIDCLIEIVTEEKVYVIHRENCKKLEVVYYD